MTLFNQTKEEWLTKENPSGKGTGVFLFKDPVHEFRKEAVRDLTYEECQAMAVDCHCFSWVPHSVSSYEEMFGDSCSPRG